MAEAIMPQQNHLLAALSGEVQQRLFSYLELVEMPLGKVLHESLTDGAQLLLLGAMAVGLFTGPEAEDAATDPFGRHLAFPYTIIDEGALARRTLWWGEVETVQPFDERFDRLTAMTPLEGSPTFLRGRFVRQPGSDLPLAPPGAPGLDRIEALAWSGAAALGVADPAIGTAKSAVARQLALQTGDTSSLVIASWAQAAAAHARGELHRSVWADLQETSHVPHLALRVFDGHLCITQRFLYGARPYAEVIEFADALATEAQRLGAARGHAFGITLRGEAEWLAGDLAAARAHLREGARLHRTIGGSVGEALSLQRLAEVSLHEGRRDEARALIDEALDVARQTDIGFHLMDRIYGTRINLHRDDPDAALYVMEDASESVRGPLETCPGCRITFAVPAAIAAARAGELDLANQHEEQCAYLANVVMRLPAWYAAHEEVRGHIAAARTPRDGEAVRQFTAAAARFRQAGQPLDALRYEQLAMDALKGKR